ncbi:MAG: flagellar hook-basal body complex protein [Lachnospiraceae bacterium]|nr:flagellar hook-basal body complex protein [Lachnospiraceae bacterium]
MLRSMDSAVSGLRAHQNKLDVIGHNIANVNTNGFKAQNYTFKDTMYQTSTASTNGTNTAGGVNAAQYGYGALMGVISMDMTASTPTYKGGFNATIDGSGFFITNSQRLDAQTVSGTADEGVLKSSSFGFTRVGQFNIDSNGYITDGNGNFVYGFRVNDDGTNQSTNLETLRVPAGVLQKANGDYEITWADAPAAAMEALDVQINKMGDVQVSLNIQYETTDASGATTTEEKTATITIGQVAIATFQNEEGLTKDGNGYYVSTPSDNTGTCSAGRPGDGRSKLMPGYLEASNVDMATEFSEMIMTQRGFQANSKIITVSDEILNDLINMKR